MLLDKMTSGKQRRPTQAHCLITRLTRTLYQAGKIKSQTPKQAGRSLRSNTAALPAMSSCRRLRSTHLSGVEGGQVTGEQPPHHTVEPCQSDELRHTKAEGASLRNSYPSFAHRSATDLHFTCLNYYNASCSFLLLPPTSCQNYPNLEPKICLALPSSNDSIPLICCYRQRLQAYLISMLMKVICRYVHVQQHTKVQSRLATHDCVDVHYKKGGGVLLGW